MTDIKKVSVNGNLITLSSLNAPSIKKAMTKGYGIKIKSCRSIGGGMTAIVVPNESAVAFNSFARNLCIVSTTGRNINIKGNSSMGWTEVVCFLNKTQYDYEMNF